MFQCFNLFPTSVHSTGFSFCFFLGFLATFILLSSNNNNLSLSVAAHKQIYHAFKKVKKKDVKKIRLNGFKLGWIKNTNQTYSSPREIGVPRQSLGNPFNPSDHHSTLSYWGVWGARVIESPLCREMPAGVILLVLCLRVHTQRNIFEILLN